MSREYLFHVCPGLVPKNFQFRHGVSPGSAPDAQRPQTKDIYTAELKGGRGAVPIEVQQQINQIQTLHILLYTSFLCIFVALNPGSNILKIQGLQITRIFEKI